MTFMYTYTKTIEEADTHKREQPPRTTLQVKRQALVALAEADRGDDEEETSLIQPSTSEVAEQSKSVAALPGFDLSSYPSSSSPPRESEPHHPAVAPVISTKPSMASQGLSAGVHFAISEVSREDGQWSVRSSVTEAPQVKISGVGSRV